ncbi:MAG: transcription termination/antitermination protein NusG [Candidatus Terrybacteria bacterium CG10_big_fil_rev_8_21_14_0_10_41_10]|uniref:Transcription termination/antitermination protein NusG n=1 Tax=Candidatus Terrybacteria bacterium CG10_big_fil_rev_8_21_14_0_10_41_10 TaxID=1975026 RepID=A0A2M8LB70_9BACT|nr:MAG: transcription termination/antitermination protein NusG [Candidatus Terrybacteria bacterium CG10_big_fil_rev_8_21_14_0_10_41_10]
MSKQKVQVGRRWYAVHTYAGYEDTVVRNLKQRIDSLGMEDVIFNAVVPTEKKIKIQGGKRKVVEEKIYPGYVLVDMVVTDNSWYVVRNTPRVTGFVGAGTTPVPLDEKEIKILFDIMGVSEPKYKLDVKLGDVVKITDGPFKDFEGNVSEIDEERGKIKMLIPMFGRETPVEIDFLQVKKI